MAMELEPASIEVTCHLPGETTVTLNRLPRPILDWSFSAITYSLMEIGEQAGPLPVDQQLEPEPAAQPVVEPGGQLVQVDLLDVDVPLAQGGVLVLARLLLRLDRVRDDVVRRRGLTVRLGLRRGAVRAGLLTVLAGLELLEQAGLARRGGGAGEHHGAPAGHLGLLRDPAPDLLHCGRVERGEGGLAPPRPVHGDPPQPLARHPRLRRRR